MHLKRPTNRLGGNRGLNQTKGDWKDSINEYSSSAHILSTNGTSCTHSLPRNQQHNSYLYDTAAGDHSSKSTSSAASLTISKQNIATTNVNNYNSSVSPKPYKWPNKDGN